MFILLKSLLLSLLFSFTIPLALIGVLLLIFSGLEHVSTLRAFIGDFNDGLKIFLTIFGNGSLVLGMVIIGLACSLVGGLLELFNIFQQRDKYRNYSKKI